MKIAVLMKLVPDTWASPTLNEETGWLDRDSVDMVPDEISERAMEVALRAKDAGSAVEVVAVTMGPHAAAAAVRKGLAMGADSGIHISDEGLRGSDVLATSAALAAALRPAGFDLIVAGAESTDGRGGVVPAMVAERLGIPALTSLSNVELRHDSVVGTRLASDGLTTVRTALPAVISITEACAEPRFPGFKGLMGAKRKPVAGIDAASLALAAAGASTMVSVTPRPPRSAGTIIDDDGTAAAALVEFLASERRI